MPCRGPEPLEFINPKLIKKLEHELNKWKHDDIHLSTVLWAIEDLIRDWHKATKAENNNLTRWLCHVLNDLPDDYTKAAYADYPKMKDWKKKHDEWDAEQRRLKQEMEDKYRKRQEALAKLTSEERKLLGIK